MYKKIKYTYNYPSSLTSPCEVETQMKIEKVKFPLPNGRRSRRKVNRMAEMNT
jgi:hypothetical protein